MGHIYHICGYIAKSVLQKRSSLTRVAFQEVLHDASNSRVVSIAKLP
jgi:hypothetical protein